MCLITCIPPSSHILTFSSASQKPELCEVLSPDCKVLILPQIKVYLQTSLKLFADRSYQWRTIFLNFTYFIHYLVFSMLNRFHFTLLTSPSATLSIPSYFSSFFSCSQFFFEVPSQLFISLLFLVPTFVMMCSELGSLLYKKKDVHRVECRT